MARNPESFNMPNEDFLVPSDHESIECSNNFGRRLQEYAGMLDKNFTPDIITTHHKLPFGRFGDGELSVLRQQDIDTVTLSLGFRSAEEEGAGGFYASKNSHADVWLGNQKQKHPDWRVAKMLDANWPTFTIDDSGIRAIVQKDKSDILFGDIAQIISQITEQYGAPTLSERTFVQRWNWDGPDTRLPGEARITISQIDKEPQTYKMAVTLPHDHQGGLLSNVTCTAHLNAYFGVSYEINVDDPDLTKLENNLQGIAVVMEKMLDAIFAARRDHEIDTTNFDAWR